MDEVRDIMLSKRRERRILYDFTHVEFKKQNKQAKGEKRGKPRKRLNCVEQTDGYQSSGGWGNGFSR